MRTIDGLAGGTITAHIHQKPPSYHSAQTSQPRLQLPQQRLQQQSIQPQTSAISPSINSNSRLSYQLATPAITSANQRTADTELQIQQKINQIKEITQQRMQTQSQQLSNTRVSNVLPNNGQQIATNIVNNSRTQNSSPHSTYHMHTADQQLVRPQPQQSPQIQTSVANIESLGNRRNSAQLNSSPVITQSNQANDRNISNNTITTANTNEPVVGHISRTQSTETAVPTTPKSMPVVSQMLEEMPLNEVQSDDSSKSAESILDTTSADSGVSTTNSNEKSDDIRDENKENKIVARIAPITPEFDSSDQTNDEIDDDIEEDGFCVVCRKEYGEFLCCERCPRAFHIDCHVPELKKMPEFVISLINLS